jgi:antitoxin component YwqK of YwqJK toxin-antitoxin module
MFHVVGKMLTTNLILPVNFEKINYMRCLIYCLTLVVCGWIPATVFSQPQKEKNYPLVRKVLASALEVRNGVAYAPMKANSQMEGSSPFTGIAIVLWPDNRINTEQGYLNGYKDGTYKELTEKGIFVAEETWASGKKNGYFKYADEKTGVVVVEGGFRNDSLDGEIKGYYMNGLPMYVKHYREGIRQGSAISYFDNGKVEQIANFDNDMPDGAVISYYPDSILRYVKEYKKGLPHGRNYLFHRNGCAANEDYYKDGKHDSISRVYDAVTCNLIAESKWKMGKRDGSFIEYNAFGDTLRIETFKENQRDGRFLEMKDAWDDAIKKMKLQVESEGLFQEGVRQGPWVHGQVSHYQQRSGSYTDGEMVGRWIFMDNNGEPLVEQVYDDKGEVLKEKYFKTKKR